MTLGIKDMTCGNSRRVQSFNVLCANAAIASAM